MTRPIKEEFKKYLSGFFDGDGSITVEKLNKSGYTLRIKFCQSNEKWIQTIQRVYPFMHYDGGLRRDGNKCEYQLRAAGKQIEPLVDDLLNYSILKYEQLLEAKKFFELINVKGKSDEKEKCYLKLKELKKQSNIKPYERLSKEYIAGLFDAEGSIGIYTNTLRVKITQKSDTIILQKIADMYNNSNKIDNHAISFYGINSLKLLNDILSFCVYKIPQIKAAINYINTLNCELSEEIKIQRQEYIKIISEEKSIDTSNLLFKSQESHKVYLRDCFDAFSKLSYHDVLNYCKMKEIEETKNFSKFENKIYNIDDWNNLKINPILEFCETNNQLQIYQYYRKKVSSLPLTGVVGRAIRILVKDTITDKYIGIMCLSSDVYNLGERDNYIKMTSQNIDWKTKYLKNIMNLSCCVPLQPFGFNTTGGKLLASLSFSKEVFDYYLSKYKEPLFAIITTSINGKSIQYDRLSCLKLIGYTKGYGSVNIPNNLYKVCQEYNNMWKVIEKSNRIDRFNFLKNLLGHLELPQKILQHNNKRGIYFGYLFSTKLNDNLNINELKTVNEIYNLWNDKWCKKRISNLFNRNAIKTSFDLYTIESFKDGIQFNLLPIKEKVITDKLIKEILSYKTTVYSQNEVSTLLNKKYNIQLVSSDISRIYIGDIKPEIIDDEYLELVSIKSSKKKITDEQIEFILDLYNKKDYIIYADIAQIVNDKFNSKITKGTVSDVIRGKIQANIKRTEPNKDKHKKINLEDKFNLLNYEQLLMIIKMKGEKKTTQEVSDYIKNNYNIYINRNFISKLWTGEISSIPEEIKTSKAYLDMLENKKQRTVKSKKFTDEEIHYLKTFDGSLSHCCQEFEKQFNKNVSRTYISKLRNI
jgi:hypothetical protein